MRFVFGCASAFALCVSIANAAVVTVNTADHPQGPNSKISLSLDLLGAQTIDITDVGISGTLPIDYLLDGSDSGTIQVVGGAGNLISLANVSQAFTGGLLEGTIETVGVGMQLTLGPETVVNRNLSISSSSAGGLSLNSGTLKLVLTGGSLYSLITDNLSTNVLEINLASNSLQLMFSALATDVSVAATADNSSNGLDTDGGELNVPLEFTTDIDLGGLPAVATTTGNLWLGTPSNVPEFGSIGLLSATVAGVGGLLLARRRRSA